MLYTRTDGLPQPVATSDLLNLYLLENGNLEVRMPGPDAKKQLAEMRENHRDFDSIWRDLFAQSDFFDGDYWVNYFFALSSIPNICHGSIWDEDKDEPSEFENVWAFYEYVTVDEFELLAEGRSVIFTAVPADKEPNDFTNE